MSEGARSAPGVGGWDPAGARRGVGSGRRGEAADPSRHQVPPDLEFPARFLVRPPGRWLKTWRSWWIFKRGVCLFQS